MKSFDKLAETAIGTFVCDDGGIFKGQCPQFIKWLVIIVGGYWQGKTGNGNEVLSIMVDNFDGYWGESKYPYRLCSADNKYDKNGHCWLEVQDESGKWWRFEQNVENAGAKSANFGSGTVYSVTKTDKALPSYLYNIKKAGHKCIDYYYQVYNEQNIKPEPTPSSKYPDYFKEWVNNLADYLKKSIKE